MFWLWDYFFGDDEEEEAGPSLGNWAQNTIESQAQTNVDQANRQLYNSDQARHDPTPERQEGTKIGSYNRLNDRGVYDNDPIARLNSFWNRHFGIENAKNILSDPAASTILIVAGAYSFRLAIATATRIPSALRGLSQFYFRNQTTINLVSQGALDGGLPSFPNLIPHWKYAVGFGSGYMIYRTTNFVK
jgi:hypothetical protein